MLAVGRPAGPVAGAVEAGAGRPVGIGHEPRGGQARLAVVAPGQARPADVQLTGGARGTEPQGAVEDVGGGLGRRPSDEDGAGVVGRAFPDRRVDGGLGRPVGVDHAPAGGEAGHDLRRDRLAAGDQGQRRRGGRGRPAGRPGPTAAGPGR